MKCSSCRNKEAIYTDWEKLRSWLLWHLFPLELKEEKANSFTQGFSDGYKVGHEHERIDIKKRIKAGLIDVFK